MDALNNDDFKVLAKVDRGLLKNDVTEIKEFPELTQEGINRSLDKLSFRGLIVLDKDTWTLTYDGQEMVQKNANVEGEIYSSFF